MKSCFLPSILHTLGEVATVLLHCGLRFAFSRSYNLSPSSLITRSICLHNGAARVITQQEWQSKERSIGITGSKRILETTGRIQLDTHRCLDCSKARLFQPQLIIIALARMPATDKAKWRECPRRGRLFTRGGTVEVKLFIPAVTFFIRRTRSFQGSIRRLRFHQARRSDGQGSKRLRSRDDPSHSYFLMWRSMHELYSHYK